MQSVQPVKPGSFRLKRMNIKHRDEGLQSDPDRRFQDCFVLLEPPAPTRSLSDILPQYQPSSPEFRQAGLVFLLDPFRNPLHRPFDHGTSVLLTSRGKAMCK